MFYSQSSLDRADHLRKQEAELKRVRHQDTSLLVPVWQGKSLTGADTDSGQLEALMFQSTELADSDTVFLGRDELRHYFAVDLSSMSETECTAMINRARTRAGEPIADMAGMAGDFRDLRSTGPVLSAEDGSLLAYARGMIYWNSNTRYCYRCGSALAHHYHGHHKQCASESCRYTLFPRTDPAVIMLVTHSPAQGNPAQCLLGRSPAWPEGVFSTLAGFVEPGESLEMAVRREVLEEAAIMTDDVRYVASQPWPFPRSIMLGFEARAISTEITCDPDELADARWFTRDELRNFGNWGDETDNFKLPRPDSIARHLIDRWIDEDAS